MRPNLSVEATSRVLRIFAVVAATAVSSCSTSPPQTPAPAASAGLTRESAIEVCMPQGEREYLARLRCEDGAPPTFERTGSVGSRNDLPEQMPGESTKDYESRLFGSASSLLGAPLKTGDVDYHVVDRYRVSCRGTQRMVFLDMYHCGVKAPSVAPAGFSVVPR